MTSLFQNPRNIKKAPKELPLYRAKHVQRDDESRARWADRSKALAGHLGLRAVPQDRGETCIYRGRQHSLEVFRASDSFRWTHEKLAFREQVRSRKRMPNDADARRAAAEWLRSFPSKPSRARFSHLSYAEVTRTRRGRTPRKQITEVIAHYSFKLSRLPVFGPGAKLQVAMVEDGKPSQVLNFWREVAVDKQQRRTPIIAPAVALKRFGKDARFRSLRRRSGVEARINSITLGYYALPPGQVQQFLIPVYRVDAQVSTKALPNHRFTDFVVAVDINADTLKLRGVVDDPSVCRII